MPTRNDDVYIDPEGGPVVVNTDVPVTDHPRISEFRFFFFFDITYGD